MKKWIESSYIAVIQDLTGKIVRSVLKGKMKLRRPHERRRDPAFRPDKEMAKKILCISFHHYDFLFLSPPIACSQIRSEIQKYKFVFSSDLGVSTCLFPLEMHLILVSRFFESL